MGMGALAGAEGKTGATAVAASASTVITVGLHGTLPVVA